MTEASGLMDSSSEGEGEGRGGSKGGGGKQKATSIFRGTTMMHG